MGVFGAYTLTNIILVYAFSNFNTSFFKPLFSIFRVHRGKSP